MNINILTWK